jgi:nucleotide-binding universal stress UspA family protein
MGTKRRTDEYRQFVGSVTQRVADLSSAPVLIVKTEE